MTRGFRSVDDKDRNAADNTAPIVPAMASPRETATRSVELVGNAASMTLETVPRAPNIGSVVGVSDVPASPTIMKLPKRTADVTFHGTALGITFFDSAGSGLDTIAGLGRNQNVEKSVFRSRQVAP